MSNAAGGGAAPPRYGWLGETARLVSDTERVKARVTAASALAAWPKLERHPDRGLGPVPEPSVTERFEGCSGTLRPCVMTLTGQGLQ